MNMLLVKELIPSDMFVAFKRITKQRDVKNMEKVSK